MLPSDAVSLRENLLPASSSQPPRLQGRHLLLLPQEESNEHHEEHPGRPRRPPKLLEGIRNADGGLLSTSACVIEANGAQQLFSHIRVRELAHHLWPGGPQSASRLRRLWFLSDTTKQGFLLHSTRRDILVRAGFVRAMVETNRVVFLCTDGSVFASFKEELLQLVSALSGEGSPFSSRMVESIVCAAVTMCTLRLQVLKPAAESILRSIILNDPDAILQLYPLRLAVSSFVEQTRPLAQGLRHTIVHETERESERKLTRSGSPQNTWHVNQSGSRLAVEVDTMYIRQESEGAWPEELPGDLQDVLHSWAHSAEELMADASQISAAIDDTTRFLEASMSCARNQLILFELWMGSASVALSLGTLISGVLGMNLTSGMETMPEGFGGALYGILGLGALVFVVSAVFLAISQHHYHRNSASFGYNRLLFCIEDDEYVLSLCANGSLPTVEIDKVLEELQMPASPVVSDAGTPAARRGRARRPSLTRVPSKDHPREAAASHAGPTNSLG